MLDLVGVQLPASHQEVKIVPGIADLAQGEVVGAADLQEKGGCIECLLGWRRLHEGVEENGFVGLQLFWFACPADGPDEAPDAFVEAHESLLKGQPVQAALLLPCHLLKKPLLCLVGCPQKDLLLPVQQLQQYGFFLKVTGQGLGFVEAFACGEDLVFAEEEFDVFEVCAELGADCLAAAQEALALEDQVCEAAFVGGEVFLEGLLFEGLKQGGLVPMGQGVDLVEEGEIVVVGGACSQGGIKAEETLFGLFQGFDECKKLLGHLLQ